MMPAGFTAHMAYARVYAIQARCSLALCVRGAPASIRAIAARRRRDSIAAAGAARRKQSSRIQDRVGLGFGAAGYAGVNHSARPVEAKAHRRGSVVAETTEHENHAPNRLPGEGITLQAFQFRRWMRRSTSSDRHDRRERAPPSEILNRHWPAATAPSRRPGRGYLKHLP